MSALRANRALRIALCLALAVPGAGFAAVTVEYVHPEKFTDIGQGFHGGEATRAAYLEALNRHLRERAGRMLGASQDLQVRITDVDMAGEFEPWHGAGAEIRIVRNVYPSRIDLDFRLADAGGMVVKKGERHLRGNGIGADTTLYGSDPLRHEKALIDDWLEREFASR